MLVDASGGLGAWQYTADAAAACDRDAASAVEPFDAGIVAFEQHRRSGLAELSVGDFVAGNRQPVDFAVTDGPAAVAADFGEHRIEPSHSAPQKFEIVVLEQPPP